VDAKRYKPQNEKYLQADREVTVHIEATSAPIPGYVYNRRNLGVVMSKRRAVLAALLTLTLCLAIPSFAKDKDTSPGRLLTGKVIDGGDNPLPNAVVYVTDTRTRAVKTYIVGADGSYRFPALAANVDYEIYAQANGKSSDTKKMNQFDDRKVVNIVLKIDK
jgi:hypothetical protein